MQTSTALARSDRPFLPEDRDLSRSLVRACTAAALARMSPPGKYESTEAIIEKAWPRDRAALAILRAAVPPMSTSSTGMSGLLPTVAGDFVSGLQQQSAAAVLIANGISVDLTGIYSVSVPRADPSQQPLPTFYAEGAPIAVADLILSSGTCGPERKLAVLTALSNSLADYSTPNAEVVIRTVLTEASARALDSSILSANDDGGGIRPPGILHNVTPLTPTAGGGLAAAATDIENLVAAIGAAGGGRRVLVFLPPGKAAALPMLAPGLKLELVPAPSLPAGNVVAVDPAGFISSLSSAAPRIDVGRSATLHMEDTTPLPIGTPGSPNVVAAPVRSMFQTDSYSLRLLLPCSWTMRGPGLVQWISSASW